MASRDIKHLTNGVQEKLELLKKHAADAGIFFILTCTKRDRIEQLALYAQGRMSLNFVNMLRREALLREINDVTNKRRVTWTLASCHIPTVPGGKVTAFDVVLQSEEGKIHWDIKADVNDNEIPDYEELGIIGERVGLIWGGRFRNSRGILTPDRPHFQFKGA